MCVRHDVHLSLEQEEPPVSSTRTVNLGGKWREWELVCARQNAWSILCGAGAWASMGLWSKANTETTRSHNGAHKLWWEGPQLSVAFWSTARPLTHIKRWKWRVYIHTLLPCPDINECNYSRIFAFKEWEEGREGNVTLRAPSLNSQVCIMGFCRNILGRVYMYLPRCNIGEGGEHVHWPDYSCQHNAHSHYKYMLAVLHNWIKSEATVPQNKKAVRLMRTRSGSERCRIVPVSISCVSLFLSIFPLWVTPKNTGYLMSINRFKKPGFNIYNFGLKMGLWAEMSLNDLCWIDPLQELGWSWMSQSITWLVLNRTDIAVLKWRVLSDNCGLFLFFWKYFLLDCFFGNVWCSQWKWKSSCFFFYALAVIC